jgi:hypothetical protein
MSYGLWVIIGIRKADLGSDVLAFLRADIYISYFLGIYAFILLAIYIRNVLDLLDLTKILGMLSRDVTKEGILSVERSGDMNDPLKPIVDIIISSMNRFDEGGVEEGLSLIEEIIIKLLDNHNFNEMEQKKLSAILFPHVEIIFNSALNKRDESICDKLVSVIEAIGQRSAERDCIIAYESAQFLGRVGKKAAEIKDPLFDDIIINIVLALTSIGEKSATKNSETLANASMSLLGAIAEIAKDRSKIIDIIDKGQSSIGNASEKGTVQKAGREASQAISPYGQ